MQVLLTTVPGLETIVEAEALGLGARPGRGPAGVGRVVVEVVDGSPLGPLRTVHEVIELWSTARLELGLGLDAVRVAARSADLPPVLARTFRVTGTRRARHATHGFDRVGLERAVGGALHARTGIPVRLDAPELVVRADLVDDLLHIGRLVRSEPLGARRGPFNQRVSLSPLVAAAAVRLASDLDPAPRAVLDPFCGAGTLLVEAGSLFPGARLLGGDLAARAVEGARANVDAAGLTDRARLERGEARAVLAALEAASIDLVVANPPFGLRLGRGIRFFGFYRRLLRAVARVLAPGGRVVLVVHRVRQLEEAARAEGFRVGRRVPLELGDTRPTLVALDRAAEGGAPSADR